MKQGIVNDTFHAKTKALVQSAIALLISCIQKGDEIPLQISETYKVTGPGGWSMEYEDKPDYDIFILHHEKEIEALPEFRLWTEAVYADPVVSRHIGHVVGTRHGMIYRSAWEYVSDLVLAHFPAKPSGLAFDPKTFERKYRDMELLFYNDMIGFKLFSPLQNFESDAAVIDLGRAEDQEDHNSGIGGASECIKVVAANSFQRSHDFPLLHGIHFRNREVFSLNSSFCARGGP